MRLEFIHVCDMAFATEGSKNVNIIGIFEHINASNFPAAHPRFAVVVGVSGEAGPYHKKFKIYKEGETEPLIETDETGFEIGETGKHYLVNDFIGMVFPGPGKYEVEIIIDSGDVLIPRASFEVKQL